MTEETDTPTREALDKLQRIMEQGVERLNSAEAERVMRFIMRQQHFIANQGVFIQAQQMQLEVMRNLNSASNDGVVPTPAPASDNPDIKTDAERPKGKPTLRIIE